MKPVPIPLIAFTGGLDSTLMLLDALKEGPVDTLYIKGRQSEAKIEQELKAREWVFDYIRRNPDIYRQVRYDTTIDAGLHHATLRHMNLGKEVPYERIVDVLEDDANIFYQPATWLFNAALLMGQHANSCLRLAYITGDHAPVILHELKELWVNLQKCLYPTKSKQVPVEFPLIWCSKDDVLQRLAGWHHRDLLDGVWFCEKPNTAGEVVTACGQCKPCQRHAMHYQAFLTNEENAKNSTKDVPPPPKE